MKKVLIILPLLFALSSASVSAAYSYCRYSQQTSSDSWNIYINRSGSGISGGMEYRYSYIVSGVVYWSAWTALPNAPSVYVGGSGNGGGILSIEIRSSIYIGSTNTNPVYTLSPC